MHLLRAAAALALTAALVAACGDDERRGADWPTSSSAAGLSSQATPPSRSTPAPDNESARHFVRRWVRLGNQMQSTGDTDGYLAVAGPDCAPCTAFADRVAKIYKAGGWIKGGRERVVDLVSESSTQWLLTTDVEPASYIEKVGAETKRYKGGRAQTRLFLAKVDGEWIVGDAEAVQ